MAKKQPPMRARMFAHDLEARALTLLGSPDNERIDDGFRMLLAAKVIKTMLGDGDMSIEVEGSE